MKIHNLLHLYEELSVSAQKNLNKMEQEDYDTIRQFLKDVLEYGEFEDIPTNNFTTTKVVNLLNKTHGNAGTTTVLPSNDRTVQTRAYAFGDDPDREVKMGSMNEKIYSVIVDALKENNLWGNRGAIARVRDFLGKSGVSHIGDIVGSDNAFKQAVANHYGNTVNDRSIDLKSRTAKNLDFNSFVFLVSMEIRQGRGKHSWDDYVNPAKLSEVTRAFGLSTLDKQAAYDNLKMLGFITKNPETNKYSPDRQKIKDFKDHLITSIERISEGGLKFSTASGSGREQDAAKKYIAAKELLDSYIPHELKIAAERRAFSAIEAMAAKRDEPAVRSVIKAYKNRKEESGEYGLKFTETSVELVDPVVQRIKTKYIIAQLNNILTSNKVEVNIRGDYSSLVRSINQKSKNFN